MGRMTYILVVLLMIVVGIEALQQGDRISTTIQSLHAGWKTALFDIPLPQMPQFRVKSSSVMRVTLPRETDNSPEMKLNPSEDLKVSITFENNKLVLPWVVLYDATNRRSLRKLVITFSHDEFEILRFRHQLVCEYIPEFVKNAA